MSVDLRDEKGISLSQLFKYTTPYIILIQESMCGEIQAIETFSMLLPGRNIFAISSNGLSRGLITCWNSRVLEFKSYKFCGGILLEGILFENNRTLNVFNCYGPYREREPIWNHLKSSVLLNLPNLVIARDLHFLISTYEVC